jgi:hypothetical protein
MSAARDTSKRKLPAATKYKDSFAAIAAKVKYIGDLDIPSGGKS